jgi:hypothetical protein
MQVARGGVDRGFLEIVDARVESPKYLQGELVETEDEHWISMMETHDDYKKLDKEFAQRLGYSNRGEIPVNLVEKLAHYCDAHPEDLMTAFYARSLINKYFRKRTKERWGRLFASMNASLHRKKFLTSIFLDHMAGEEAFKYFDCASIWHAIDDNDDGYGKANLIKMFAPHFDEDTLRLAYLKANSMPPTFKIRALAGLYPMLDERAQQVVYSYLLEESASGSFEAQRHVINLFPGLSSIDQSGLIDRYLKQRTAEQDVAYFTIRVHAFLKDGIAQKFIERIRCFQSVYLKNRCLLKLSRYLPPRELDTLYEQFMEAFSKLPPSPELIHNLYHFSAVMERQDKDGILAMALNKIEQIDDSNSELYEQGKYHELVFVTPHLGEKHMHKAYAIAETVRGGYRRSIISKLKRHFSHPSNAC